MSTMIAGFRVVEEQRLPWSVAMFHREHRIVVCGEVNQFRWIVWQAAWRVACHEDLRRTLASFAERVGVEYTPTRK